MSKTVTVRELRSKSAQIWRELPEEGEMVVRNNGRAVALLTVVSDDTLQETLTALRRTKAMMAVEKIQTASVKEGRDKLSAAEIDEQIHAVRRKRSR